MADYWEGFDIGPTCPTCGAAVTPGTAYCTTCGASLSTMTPVSLVGATGGVCPVCGAALSPGASFCIMCGTPTKSSGTAAQGAAVQARPGVCPVCGEPLDPSAAFCIMCGTPVDPASAIVSGPHGRVTTPGSPATSVTTVVGVGGGYQPDSGATTVIGVGDGYQADSGVTTVIGVGDGYQADSGVTTVIGVGDGYQPDSAVTTVVGVGEDYGVVSFEDAVQGRHAQRKRPSTPQRTGSVRLLRDTGQMADDDDPTVRPKLLMLTYDEAREGCHKQVDVDGQKIDVDIPAGVDATTKLDVMGYGYFDEMTGARGPLRLTFFLV